MATFTPQNLDVDMMHDLMDEIHELYESSEQTLIELELTPSDNEMQRSLFRNVHTIKGDLGLVGFIPMIDMLQHMEDLLDLLRKGQIEYNSNMSDLVLSILDKVKLFVEDAITNKSVQYDEDINKRVTDIIKQINSKNTYEHDDLFIKATEALDPNTSVNSNDEPETLSSDVLKSGIPKGLTDEQQVDLLFFRELMKPIEKRAGYKEGRGDRIAKLAFIVNKLSGNKIPEAQLAVACYVHDFGMAFLPADIVQKTSNLTDLEKNQLRSHVYKSARLLENLTQWDEARKMVIQHHEFVDGSGYPLGLKKNEICEGAKLIAILDKFEGLTHSSIEEGRQSLSEKEAVIAINKDYKSKLSAKWVRLFNQAVTELLLS